MSDPIFIVVCEPADPVIFLSVRAAALVQAPDEDAARALVQPQLRAGARIVGVAPISFAASPVCRIADHPLFPLFLTDSTESPGTAAAPARPR